MATSFHSATSELAENRLVQGTECDVLLRELRATQTTLAALMSHGEHLGDAMVTSLEATLADVEGRLGCEELLVGVAGEKGVGKTTFINALFGARLLPSTEQERKAVLTVRCGARHGYRVRFRGGTEEDFDQGFPDTIVENTERLEAAERAMVQAAERQGHLNAELRAGSDAVVQARAGLTDAFRAFEAAREEAARLDGELAKTEATQTMLETDASERERALPVLVVARPPPWAFWLWIVRSIFVLVHFRALRAYHDVLHDLETARKTIASLRRAMDVAAQACSRAEEMLSPSASPAESASQALSQTRAELAQLEARVAELSREAQSARAEIERIRAERPRVFFENVAALCDPTRRGNEVLEIDIVCPARHLPEGVTLVDIPGITAADPEAQQQAWDAMRVRVDACILLAELERGISGATREMLQRLRETVPHVSLVLTKLDESFMQAVRRRSGEPRDAVEQARRIGTRRFAREIGRDPGSVLSTAVAAAAVLKEGEPTGLSRRFADDVDEFFARLRDERLLILGTRTAVELRRCIQGAAVAQQQAERSYQQKLLTLLEQRTPEPNRFRKEQLEAAQPVVHERAAAIQKSAREVVSAGIQVIRKHATDRLASSSSRAAFRALGPELGKALATGIARVQVQAAHHVEERSDAAVRELEITVFEALRQRYDIRPDVTRWSNPSIHLDPPSAAPAMTLDLGAYMHSAVRKFEFVRGGFGLAGGVAGALVGSFILLGLGTALGLALGAALLFAKTYVTLRRDCLRVIDDALKGAERALVEPLDGSEEAIAKAITDAVDASVARATIRYGKWIAAPLEAERTALVRERDRLHELQLLRDRLRQHDVKLSEAMKAAADASLGICKSAETISSSPPLPNG